MSKGASSASTPASLSSMLHVLTYEMQVKWLYIRGRVHSNRGMVCPMQLDQQDMEEQLALLATHRRRLHYRLCQHARLGAYAPPEVGLDIEDAQVAIRDLKTRLHASGVAVVDLADDTALAVVTTGQL